MTIFVIETLQLDPMENERCNALYYLVIGYVNTEQEAIDIVNKGGKRMGDGWPIGKDRELNIYKYYPIEQYKEQK